MAMAAFNFPIVGIGASAGGLEAFRGFFERMPADSGMAFIVILHLPAERKSMLPDILARWTPMRVFEAADAMLVEPNCVYVPPPHVAVTLMDGRLGVKVPAIDDQKAYRPIRMPRTLSGRRFVEAHRRPARRIPGSAFVAHWNHAATALAGGFRRGCGNERAGTS